MIELGKTEEVLSHSQITASLSSDTHTDTHTDIHTQTAPTIRDSEDIYTDEKSTQQSSPSLCYAMMNDEMVAYYTGLEGKAKFDLVLNSLGPAAYHLNFRNGEVPNMTVKNQLLIKLCLVFFIHG